MSSDDEDSITDGMTSLLPERQRRGDVIRRAVPRRVIISYILIIFLQGFIYSAIFQRVVPVVIQILQISEETAAIPAQIFLLIHNITPIFTGLLSDTKYTRYRMIFVSYSVLIVTYSAMLLYESFAEKMDAYYRVYPLALLLIIIACSLGTTWVLILPFGLEQLDTDKNSMKRTSFLRWTIFTHQVGICLSYPMSILVTKYGILCNLLVLAAVAFQIFVLVIWKRHYKFNPIYGNETLRHFNAAIRNCMGFQNGNEDDSDDNFLTLDDRPEDDTQGMNLADYQKCLLRRYVFLVLIFIAFGAYQDVYYMANIVYPVQARQMMHRNRTDVTFTVDYDSAASIAILVLIPLLDILYRTTRCCRLYAGNFVLMGFALSSAALSIGTAALSHYLYGPKSTRTDPYIYKQILMSLQYAFLGIAKCLVQIAGVDLSYVESPAFLRGTFIGLYFGLGSVFGASIFFLQYSCHPIGLNHETWPYVMVFTIIVVTTLFLYTPLVSIYVRRRREFREARRKFNEDVDQTMLGYGTLTRQFFASFSEASSSDED